ncbi:hypothetical protein CsatA_012028 [Cannabis sativa]
MTREEVEAVVDEMEIDGVEQREGNAVPEGFNANYLKVYYGKLFPHAICLNGCHTEMVSVLSFFYLQ